MYDVGNGGNPQQVVNIHIDHLHVNIGVDAAEQLMAGRGAPVLPELQFGEPDAIADTGQKWEEWWSAGGYHFELFEFRRLQLSPPLLHINNLRLHVMKQIK